MAPGPDVQTVMTLMEVLVKKVKYLLLMLLGVLVLLGMGIVGFIVTLPESARSDYLFCRQMSEYTAAFDALNQAVYEQLPVYPDAELVLVGTGGGDSYFWTPTSRDLDAHYISDTPYLQIQEFFEKEMPAQDWQLMRKKVFGGSATHLYYQKQFTCVTLRISIWDEYQAKFISSIRPTSEIPLSTKSTYEVSVSHAQEAVPGAPTPHPEGESLIECFVGEL